MEIIPARLGPCVSVHHAGDHPYGPEGEIHCIEAGQQGEIRFSEIPRGGERVYLRLTVAVDAERDLRLVVRPVADPSRSVQWEIRKPCFWQIFEIELTEIRESLLRRAEVVLALESPADGRLCVYRSAPEALHQPHLLVESEGEGSWAVMEETLCSLASLQPFGWLEGCVLDGISALFPRAEAIRALDAHWNYFIEDGGSLSYLNPTGQRVREKLYSIESTLPFANPPSFGLDLKVVLDFWKENRLGNGLVADINFSPVGKPSRLTGISAEGCYTVAYPMARVGRLLERDELLDQAQAQLLERSRILLKAGTVYQKQYIGKEPYFPNWARALGWFLVGYGQTLRQIPRARHSAEALADYQRLCRLALEWQQEGGLWSVFIDRQLEADTSGSAAILAGLAIAHSLGVLPEAATVRIGRGIHALEPYISADGLLRGCAQLNRGGEELQVSSYRVIAPFAMGLAIRARHEFLEIRETALKA
jgi:unsaturated rhamnogalacturonyl hydrolase